jgi:hypothetical protein
MTEQRGGDITRTPWPGKPVTCMICLQGCVPTFVADDSMPIGWYMPAHPWDRGSDVIDHCPGSGAWVDKPTPADLTSRIEEHVVAAMPPQHHVPGVTSGTVGAAHRLTSGDDPFASPKG